MALKRIEVISIPVGNQDEALAFYQGKLGFHLLNDSVFDVDNKRWLQLGVGDDTGTSVTLVTWVAEMSPGSAQGMVLGTDDIEADRNALIAAGVEVGPIMETPWGRFAMFADPDGNGWSLHQG